MTPATSIRRLFRVCAAMLEIKAQLCHRRAHGTLEVSDFLYSFPGSVATNHYQSLCMLCLKTALESPSDEGQVTKPRCWQHWFLSMPWAICLVSLSLFLWLIGDCQQYLAYRHSNSCISLTHCISCGWTSHCILSGIRWYARSLMWLYIRGPFTKFDRWLRRQHVFWGATIDRHCLSFKNYFLGFIFGVLKWFSFFSFVFLSNLFYLGVLHLFVYFVCSYTWIDRKALRTNCRSGLSLHPACLAVTPGCEACGQVNALPVSVLPC